jgi:hypothetical protein
MNRLRLLLPIQEKEVPQLTCAHHERTPERLSQRLQIWSWPKPTLRKTACGRERPQDLQVLADGLACGSDAPRSRVTAFKLIP